MQGQRSAKEACSTRGCLCCVTSVRGCPFFSRWRRCCYARSAQWQTCLCQRVVLAIEPPLGDPSRAAHSLLFLNTVRGCFDTYNTNVAERGRTCHPPIANPPVTLADMLISNTDTMEANNSGSTSHAELRKPWREHCLRHTSSQRAVGVVISALPFSGVVLSMHRPVFTGTFSSMLAGYNSGSRSHTELRRARYEHRPRNTSSQRSVRVLVATLPHHCMSLRMYWMSHLDGLLR